MPHVLILCEYTTLSGGERSMLATLDGVRQAGFSVSVVAPSAGPLTERLRARGVETIPFCMHEPDGSRLSQDRLREKLAERLIARKPDVLHANSLSMGRLSGPVAAELEIPSVAHLRDIVKLSRQAIRDLNCHARLLAVSEATRTYHLAAGLAGEKTHVLHNGVDLDRFQPRSSTNYLRRELGLSPQSKLVGAIGQVGMRKGFDLLVRAAVTLRDELPDVHWLIVGERWSDKLEAREFETRLHATASRELPGRLHFLGYRDDIDRLLNEWTLLVHPARQEPLGRVLLEAAASGTPVVATRVGGTAEIFPERPDSAQSDSAQLVPPDDVGALAAAIVKLLDDEPLRRRLGKAARHRAQESFNATTAAVALAKHYQELCRRPLA